MAEKKSDNKGGFFSNWIVRNLIWAAVFVVVLLVGTNILLSIGTQHNKEITVPDFTNMTYEEAVYNAERVGLKVEIGDSVYVRRMKKGAVFSQFPKSGSNVKKGRTISLTTNAKTAKEVTMPLLVGYSMRQAKAELSTRGLNLGKLVYVNDIATNNVLKQQLRGRDIAAGSSVESGSEIDLVVGLNDSDNRTYIPKVTGMKYVRAVDVVHENSLNISRLVFDESVRNYNDSTNAVVYRQSPGASQAPTPMGSDVTLYLTVNPERIPK